jgi:hypothetical protein
MLKLMMPSTDARRGGCAVKAGLDKLFGEDKSAPKSCWFLLSKTKPENVFNCKYI